MSDNALPKSRPGCYPSAMGKLADKLRKAVRDSGESLNEIARATEVDSGRLSRFMRGERDLTFEAAERVALHVGLDFRFKK